MRKPLILIACLATTSAPAFAQTFEEGARQVHSRLRAARGGDEEAAPPYVFGHFPSEVVVIESNRPRVDPKTEEIVVTPPPSFKCKGVLTVRGRPQIITDRGGFFTGEKVDGYELVTITQTEVICRKNGQSFTVPAR